MQRIALVLCLALLVGASCAAADAAKWSQPPKTGPSYDFASEWKDQWVMAMADDWTCRDGVPIAGVRWWGSYWTPPVPGGYTPYSGYQNGAPPGGITSFVIGITRNAPAGGSMPFDHPDFSIGGILAAWEVLYGSANENYEFTVEKSASPLIEEKVYSYYADLANATPIYSLPGGPFEQEQGEKYWLIIGAKGSNDTNKQWGWHEAYRVEGSSYATQSVMPFLFPDAQVGWQIPCTGHDMAFELFPVPEPGSLAALALGLAGLVGMTRRIRRRSG